MLYFSRHITLNQILHSTSKAKRGVGKKNKIAGSQTLDLKIFDV